MGHNQQILVSKTIAPKSELAPNWFQTERAEDMHLHIRNLRILMGLKEYNAFCQGIAESYLRFKELGKGLGQPFDLLHRRKNLPEEAEFNANMFQVELQDPKFEGDMIHFHYRNYRFHFTKKEYEEFALLTYEGLKNLYPEKYNNGEKPKEYENRDRQYR